MLNKINIIMALVILLAQATLASGAVYFYKDADGAMHFSDVPRSPDAKLFLPQKHRKAREPYKSGKNVKDNPAIRKHIQMTAEQLKIDSKLIESIIKAESDFDPDAISPAGAVGLMQLMPETAKEMGVVDSRDPFQNITGGARYFRRMLETFGGDARLALAAYNAGPEPVKFYGKIPPFQETQKYVRKVIESHGGKVWKRGKDRIYRTVLKDGTLLLTDRPSY